MRTEIRLAGSGGQGLITAGVILAEAAGLHGGREVAQTQSYGPEARGGASRADIIISNVPIFHPKAKRLDLLLALTQESCDKYLPDLKPGGLLVVDQDLVPMLPSPDAIALPILQTVREHFKTEIYGNSAALGVLCGVADWLEQEWVEAAIKGRVPPRTLQDNLAAFQLGVEMGLGARHRPVPEPTDADL